MNIRIWAAATVICVSGCGVPPNAGDKIDNIKKVFIHQDAQHHTTYTIMWEEDGELKTHSVLGGEIKILTDVPRNKPMWAQWQGWRKCSGHFDADQFTVIHIHNIGCVEGHSREFER